MTREILLFLHRVDPGGIVMLHGGLFVCAWIGCWIATRTRTATFGWTIARGVIGGAIAGLFDPIHFVGLGFLLLGGLADRGPWFVVQSFLFSLGEGALLSLPLAIMIAVRRRRQQPA